MLFYNTVCKYGAKIKMTIKYIGFFSFSSGGVLMNRKIKILLSFLLVALLLLPILSSCGGKKEKKDTVAPTLYPPQYEDVIVGERVEVKACTAYDDSDGVINAGVRVLAPDGKEISHDGGGFIADKEGEYKIVYTAADKSGNKTEKQITFKAIKEEENTPPTLTLENESVSLKVGEELILPFAIATDNEDGELSVKFELIREGGATEIENGYVFKEKGEYLIKVSAADSKGLATEKIISVTVLPADTGKGDKEALVNGSLDEEFWQSDKTARISIRKTDTLDGVDTLIYRDEEGLRLAFLGDAHTLNTRDVIMLYISTSDSVHKIGSEILNDYYEVRGQYPAEGDYRFNIAILSSKISSVNTGLYKDFAGVAKNTGSLQIKISKSSKEYSYVGEMYIPYEFLSSDVKVTKESTLGFSVRLVGTNENGSAEWNNLFYGGVYCDSESPASYVRVDKDGKIYAALDNTCDYRVDGVFDEAVYNSEKTTLKVSDSTALLYRSDKGIHAKIVFGKDDKEISLALNTVDHKLSAPYVYDYRIRINKEGTLLFSNGNSIDFYDESLYIPYSAPRVVFGEENGNVVAELFIHYDYLSRYNTSGNYTEKGYMQIDKDSTLRIALECAKGDKTVTEFSLNGEKYSNVSVYDPRTYIIMKGE